MRLYGRDWTRRDLEARVGRVEQIGGLRRLHWTEGPEAGVEHIQALTGAGLSYVVVPARGMDISLAAFGGVPLSWQSANGEAHPAYYDPAEAGWLRSAVGGLLMTCGLLQVGSPNEDGGQRLGLHGRAHHLPARHVAAEGQWKGDEYELAVRGVVEETAIFGENVRLSREIRSRLGQNRIEIRDVVENIGFEPVPHMILYHFNFGFPLMSEETQIKFPSRRVTPREAKTPLDGFDRWQSPQHGYQERVYYHEDLITDGNANASVEIHNPSFPVAGGGTRSLVVRLAWETTALPRLVQWKMPSAGAHVMGIEPANCWVEGRAAERVRGTLRLLEPGESLVYDLALEVDVAA